MRLVGLAVLLLPACSGSDSDGGVDTGDDALNFTFKTQVGVDDLSAEFSEAAVEAHQSTNVMLGALRLLAADEKVQDQLNSYGDDGSFRGAFQCWDRPQFPQWTFTLNFGYGCEMFDLEGAASIERHSTQQLLYTFQDFVIAGREIGGTIGINTIGAFDAPLFFVGYDTEANEPAPDNPVPVGVRLNSAALPVGLSLDLGMAIDFANSQWSVWGTSTLSGDEPITVVHGAASVDEVAPDAPTGANVLGSSLDWLECRCPTSGISSQEMPIVITEVLVDIDDLEEEPDEVDDPVLTIPVDARVEGRGILNYTGCGEYELDYVADPIQITVDKQLVFAQIQFACDTRTINDPARCTAFQQALLRNSEDLTVDVTLEDITRTANASLGAQLDTNWCRY